MSERSESNIGLTDLLGDVPRIDEMRLPDPRPMTLARPAPDAWRPIATLAESGRVLLWFADDDAKTTGFCRIGYVESHEPEWFVLGYTENRHRGTLERIKYRPTHWMPLPMSPNKY